MMRGALQDNVLTLLCYGERHASGLVLRLTPDIFSSRTYRDIAAKAFDHIEQYGKPPGAHLRDLMEDRLKKGDEGKLLGQTLVAMEDLYSDMQPEYVMDRLDNFIDTQMLTRACEEAADFLAAGDLVKARETIYATHTKTTMTTGIFLSDPKAALSFLDEREEDTFTIGIDLLDTMRIRPARKTLTVLMAPAKRGKSWWCCQVGRDNMLGGKNVLHISLENSEEMTAKRYVQGLYAMTEDSSARVRVPIFERDEAGRFQGMRFDQLDSDVLDKNSRARVAKQLKKLGKRAQLLIKEFPTGKLTIPQLNAYMDWVEKNKDFKADLLVVDYPDLMKISADNLRIDTGRTFQGLRGMAVERDIAVVGVTQGNRSSSTSKVVGANQVAEDYSKVGTVDTLLTYSQTGEESELGLARIQVAAARHARDRFIVLISQSYATGQFCLDATYMHKHVEAEVNRLTGVEAEEG